MSEKSILYHYTSISGLNSIVRTRKVWASDCRYLNDRQELEQALGHFLSKLKEPVHEALELAFDWHNLSRCHCVFSLSRSPQVLSQWRAYAEDGHGAAIGFDEKYLSGHQTSSSRSLVSCVYEDHEGFVTELVNRFEAEIEALTKMYQDSGGAVDTFWKAINDNSQPLESLYSEILRIKNPAFAEEQEVRLIINIPVKHAQTRVSRGLIVPYVEHVFLEEGDRDLWCVAPEVWLGPKCDKRNVAAIGVFRQFGWRLGKGLFQYDCGYV